MLLLLDVLYPCDPSYALVRAILYHDTHERWIGDMPGPVRKRFPYYGETKKQAAAEAEEILGLPGDTLLTIDEKRWLKALDHLDFMLWCDDQIAMGNLNPEPARAGTRRWFDNNEVPKEVMSFILQYHWKRTSEDISSEEI